MTLMKLYVVLKRKKVVNEFIYYVKRKTID